MADTNRVRDARRARGWTQVQLAAVARISQEMVSSLETGRYQGSPASRARIARALGLDVTDLWPETESVA